MVKGSMKLVMVTPEVSEEKLDVLSFSSQVLRAERSCSASWNTLRCQAPSFELVHHMSPFYITVTILRLNQRMLLVNLQGDICSLFSCFLAPDKPLSGATDIQYITLTPTTHQPRPRLSVDRLVAGMSTGDREAIGAMDKEEWETQRGMKYKVNSAPATNVSIPTNPIDHVQTPLQTIPRPGPSSSPASAPDPELCVGISSCAVRLGGPARSKGPVDGGGARSLRNG